MPSQVTRVQRVKMCSLCLAISKEKINRCAIGAESFVCPKNTLEQSQSNHCFPQQNLSSQFIFKSFLSKITSALRLTKEVNKLVAAYSHSLRC